MMARERSIGDRSESRRQVRALRRADVRRGRVCDLDAVQTKQSRKLAGLHAMASGALRHLDHQRVATVLRLLRDVLRKLYVGRLVIYYH